MASILLLILSIVDYKQSSCDYCQATTVQKAVFYIKSSQLPNASREL